MFFQNCAIVRIRNELSTMGNCVFPLDFPKVSKQSNTYTIMPIPDPMCVPNADTNRIITGWKQTPKYLKEINIY